MKYTTKLLLTLSLAATANANALDRSQEKSLLEKLNIELHIPGNWTLDWDVWVSKLNELGALSQPRNQIRTLQYIDRPLFRAYPALHKIDHRGLCQLPTPIEKLSHLSSHLNHSLYIKRDDLTGGYDTNGNLRYGGNKPRKLEFLLGQAFAHNVDTFLCFGCMGSNFVTATSFYGKELGKTVHCLLKPQPNSSVVQQNLLWNFHNGANLHYYQNSELRAIHAILLWLDIYHDTGKFPFVIPTGGSNELGVLGFVNAGFELKEQIDQGLIPEPERIYVAGCCATSLGLALGCKLASIKSIIVAVAVEPEEFVGMYKENTTLLLEKTVTLLKSYDSSIPTLNLGDLNLEATLEFTGPDYGVITPEGREAMELMRTHEHINLDGTYTGKSLAALISDVRNKKIAENSTILFWDTYCGAMDVKQLEAVSYKQLPPALQHYFVDPVQ
jgi:D-cysteine desulfhydrase